MVESCGVLITSTGKRRKITHSEPTSRTLLRLDGEDESDTEPILDDFAHFDPSDDESEGSEDMCWRLTANDISEEDRQSTRQSIEQRYLRNNDDGTSSGYTVAEADAARFKWAYNVEEGPQFPPTPIWEIQVTRGREWDVLCSIFEIARQFPDDYDIVSASMTPSVAGAVYIECTFESVVRRLLLHVAFIRRLVAPKQISAEALKRTLLMTPSPIQEGSWVRIRSAGQYNHDLAWVQRFDVQTGLASLYVVPRWQVEENSQQKPGTDEGADGARPLHNFCGNQSLFQPHLDRSLDPAIPCQLYGASFHFGFLLCQQPLANLAIYRIQPCVQELDTWMQSSVYDLANGANDQEHSSHIAQRLTCGINRLLAAARRPLPFQIGQRVQFVGQDADFGAVGWVASVNENSGSVRVNTFGQVDGKTLVSVQWPVARTASHFRVGERVTVVNGPWVGLRAYIAKVDLSKAEIEVTCDIAKVGKLVEGNMLISNPNLENSIYSLVKKGRMSVVSHPRFSVLTLPMGSVCSVLTRTDAPAAGSAAPTPPLITRDPYIQMEVRAFDKNIGSFYGTVVGTSADQRLVSVRSEGRAINTIELISVENVKERHTELSLAEYSRTPQDKIHAMRTQRDNARSSVSTHTSEVFSNLPDANEAWPEAFAGNRSDISSDLPSGASDPMSSDDSTTSLVPLDWLLQSALQNCYLDVIVRGGTTKISAEYENRVGVIRSLEKVKRGKRGSVKIRFGRRLCTDRWIPVRNVFPLTTTEFEGVTTRPLAKSILDIMGIYVVIIGPDADGRRSFVGRTGFTSWGGRVNLDGVLIVFPVTSLCRSDPVAK